MKLMKLAPDVSVFLAKKPDGSEVRETISHKQYLTDIVDVYADNFKTAKHNRQRNKIISAIESAKDVLRLEDADHEIVRAAYDQCANPYSQRIGRQLVSFYDATEKVEDVKE